LRLAAVHPFVKNEDLVCSVNSVFLVCFDDEIRHSALVLKI
jgi:hypothetical protein